MATEDVVYTLESSAFPDVTLVVQEVRVEEALDHPYRARVEFVHPDLDADIALHLGKDCVLSIIRGDNVRRITGVVRHVHENEDRHHAQQIVEVEIVPALYMLSLRRDTRIFQNMTVVEILEQVLAQGLSPYGREYDLELTESYPVREYCVQYQETDLDFVERLMQEEGISYTFTHEGDKERLHLRDHNGAMPEVESGAVVEYRPDDLVITGAEPVHRFRLRHRSTTTSVTVRDWDWTRGGRMVVEAAQAGQDEAGQARESYEHGVGLSLTIGDYANPAYRAEDSARQARIRHEAHVRDAVVGVGHGSVLQFAPGTVFELTGHPVAGVDGRYLITSVEHLLGAPPAQAQEGDAGEGYTNRFTCIPADTVYRPTRRHRKPTIPSIQTAMVTGPAGEEIHVDEHGRIKVQFFWDRQNPADETSSCWVRCEQPWAGSGWGFWFVPRIGMEVVVHFIDGDPDRPLVSGCVYDGANALPYPLPDEKTKSTIKSNSSIGGGGFNELRFEDAKGSEEIYAHAQKDYNEVVEHDHNTLVHRHQTNTVDVDQTQTIHRNQTEQVDVDQTMTVDGNRTVLVESDFDETVDGTETRRVQGDVTETLGSNEKRTVTGDLTETIGGDETREIGGNLTETVSSGQALTVGGMTHEITGSLTQTIVGGIKQTTPATYDVTATGGYTVVAPGGITLTALGGLTLAAPGGVTHIDSEKSWFGLMAYDAGSTNTGICLTKTEATGMALAVVGLKVSGCVMKSETYSIRVHATSGTAIGTFGAWVANGGLLVDVVEPECTT